MKKILLTLVTLITIICLAVFAACENASGGATKGGSSDTSGIAGDASSIVNIDQAAIDSTFESVIETTSEFSISTEDGEYTEQEGAITLLTAGTYSLSGYLEGQILVDAADAEVIIELCGATIKCSTDSPIKVLNADKVEISAKKGTENVIKDARSEKKTDNDSLGVGAIYANCDLKLKGSGVLVVEANYNNGVHTTKDLTVKNLSLKVTAVNNALKGNDSVTVESGTVVLISTKGDGLKTENSDVSSKGKQRGSVTVSDGVIAIYAAGDGIQSSYDFIMNGGELVIYTGSYSSYTASDAATTSYKGVKVANELTVNNSAIEICSFDDGLHADYGSTLENGESGKGNVNINGGQITVRVYSPEKSTFGGRMGPSGWGKQQSVKGSDGIHADNTLTISDGTVAIDSAFEGLEASFIVVKGGNTTVFATDDGVNACKKVTSLPSITVEGGYLFVNVSPSGDTDGIDSNGTYTQSGGVVISCGPGSASGGMGGGAWALDTDKGVTLKGGTLILFGGMENTPSNQGMTKTVCSSSTVSAGTHTVTIKDNSYSVELKYSYSGCVVYSADGSAALK